MCSNKYFAPQHVALRLLPKRAKNVIIGGAPTNQSKPPKQYDQKKKDKNASDFWRRANPPKNMKKKKRAHFKIRCLCDPSTDRTHPASILRHPWRKVLGKPVSHFLQMPFVFHFTCIDNHFSAKHNHHGDTSPTHVFFNATAFYEHIEDLDNRCVCSISLLLIFGPSSTRVLPASSSDHSPSKQITAPSPTRIHPVYFQSNQPFRWHSKHPS